MSDERTTIRLRDYLSKRKTFVIPQYQRGYVWGKKRPGEDDSVTYLIRDLKSGFKCSPHREVFLQGVTVTESDKEISVIDGQQRTTFFYLLLKCLGSKVEFKLRYLSGRKQSQDFIDNVSSNTNLPIDEAEPFQDIYFFKKTMFIIRQELRDVHKSDFEGFILEHVKFLYINIPESQAVRVFAMMNGNKATMLPEEVIKAEILRLASQKDPHANIDANSAEWQANMLRSRYAREWDKWLHWWNREDVRTMFSCNNTMGMLISSVVGVKGGVRLTFDLFKKWMSGGESPQEAKMVFDRLRRQQKLFEDLFNDFEMHNKVGAIIAVLRKSGADDVVSFVHDFIASPKGGSLKLDDYYKCVFLGMTHREIIQLLTVVETATQKGGNAKDAFVQKYDETLKALHDPFLYTTDRESAFRYLLRRNVDQDTHQKRKFDFGVWEAGARSLEHIYPKSKVWHWKDENMEEILDGNDSPISLSQEIIQADGNGYLARSSLVVRNAEGTEVFSTTEHGIGNLVLLYKDENSSFNNSPFEVKRELFFNPNKTELTKSRRLLHTVCVFAGQKDWNGQSIVTNAQRVLYEFKDCYKDLCGRFYV